jgi:hypothetical protein
MERLLFHGVIPSGSKFPARKVLKTTPGDNLFLDRSFVFSIFYV